MSPIYIPTFIKNQPFFKQSPKRYISLTFMPPSFIKRKNKRNENMLKLSLVVPCYNEEKTLLSIIERTESTFAAHSIRNHYRG